MQIQFACPSCSARIGAPEEMNGDSIECPQCETGLLVPDPTVASQPSDNGMMLAEEAPIKMGIDRDKTQPEMDMTPMVDVTFLLLIFFMVTAAFSMQQSFEIPTPQEERPSTEVTTLDDFEDDPDFVVVRIDENSTFYISTAAWDEEREAPSRQDLLINLKQAKDSSESGPTKLLIVAHGESWHEKVVMAMDVGTEVGLEEVKIVSADDDV